MLLAIKVEADACNVSGRRKGDRHAMLAFVEADDVGQASETVTKFLETEGWSNCSLGAAKDLTGHASEISDDDLRQAAEGAQTGLCAVIVYNDPLSRRDVN